MHSLIATFFATIFTFGSHAPAHRSTTFVPPAEYAGGINYAVPSRHEILDGKYAEAECSACRMTNVSFTTR